MTHDETTQDQTQAPQHPARAGDEEWTKVGMWGPAKAVKVRRDWGPRDVLVAVAVLLGANVALAVPVVAWMLLANPGAVTPNLATNPLVLTGGLLTLWAVFTLVPRRVTRRYGTRSVSADFGFRAPSRTDWFLGVKIGLAMRAVDLGAGWGAARLGWTTGDNSDWLFAPRAWAMTVFFVAGAALVAPVVEELFFRGFILRALAKTKKLAGRASTAYAVLGSSVIFGALHTTAFDVAGLYVVVSTTTAGAVLAVLAVRRGNLGASIAAHIVFNVTGVVGAWVLAR